ncbi:MAG: GTPase HflX, partial [Hyphomicrobiales bacterium]|nr:GTPase HflX [Hyphomicrobiales bacterium]
MLTEFGSAESLGRREQAVAAHTRTLVVCPFSTSRAGSPERGPARSPEARREEAVGLAFAIDLNVVDSALVPLSEIRPASYLGKGKVAELAERVKEDAIDLVVMDCALSPVQQRNLEREFKAKVIDRTGLILEIFGRRARTAEGSLQV